MVFAVMLLRFRGEWVRPAMTKRKKPQSEPVPHSSVIIFFDADTNAELISLPPDVVDKLFSNCIFNLD